MRGGSGTEKFATFFVTERGANDSAGRVEHYLFVNPFADGVSKGTSRFGVSAGHSLHTMED
jgi:hypothetical protein